MQRKTNKKKETLTALEIAVQCSTKVARLIFNQKKVFIFQNAPS
jgi:hypothetical protein